MVRRTRARGRPNHLQRGSLAPFILNGREKTRVEQCRVDAETGDLLLWFSHEVINQGGFQVHLVDNGFWDEFFSSGADVGDFENAKNSATYGSDLVTWTGPNSCRVAPDVAFWPGVSVPCVIMSADGINLNNEGASMSRVPFQVPTASTIILP
jgi:hypothetical protein